MKKVDQSIALQEESQISARSASRTEGNLDESSNSRVRGVMGMENVSKSAIATKSGGKPGGKVASSSALTEVKTEGGVPEEESKEDDEDQIEDETPQEI